MSQTTLAAKLQIRGVDISRQMLANIEVGRKEVKDWMLPHFQRILQVPIVRFFSQEVQADDVKFAALPPGSLKVALKKCQKLTKRRKKV